MNPELSQLPAPPKGQQGITFESLQHLPPPPSGQQGVTLDQINSQSAQSQSEQPKKNFLQRVGSNIKNAFQSGVQQTKEGFQQATHTSSPLKAGEGLLKAGAGAVAAAFSPLAPISKPIEGAVNAEANVISNIPAVQRFAQTKVGQGVARGAEDVANAATIAGTVGGFSNPAKVAGAISDVASTGAQKVSNIVTKVGDKVNPSFETQVNKALPVLKKDLANLPKKQQNIYTAFSDIINNKESLGLTDKMGNPRLPETFTETIDAQNVRLPEIYKSYTSKLQGADKVQFDQTIHEHLVNQMTKIDDKLAKENSIDNRRALVKIKNEIGSLRDPSPEGIQNYIQTINQKTKPTAPGGALNPEQIQYANLAGDLRKVLDDSIEKTGGKGYQDERNTYAAHKSIQSQLMMAAKKELNKNPGLTDKLANAGLTLEGVNFLLTHNPQALIMGGAIKGANMFSKWLRSPQRALRGAFSKIEGGYKMPSPSNPETIK